jgi:hypothetical protein
MSRRHKLCKDLRDNIPSRWNSKCKDHNAGMSLASGNKLVV